MDHRLSTSHPSSPPPPSRRLDYQLICSASSSSTSGALKALAVKQRNRVLHSEQRQSNFMQSPALAFALFVLPICVNIYGLFLPFPSVHLGLHSLISVLLRVIIALPCSACVRRVHYEAIEMAVSCLVNGIVCFCISICREPIALRCRCRRCFLPSKQASTDLSSTVSIDV